MCVIVLKPKNVEMRVMDIEAMHWQNPHGIGLATQTRDGGFIVRKMLSLKEAIKAIKTVSDKQAIVHFRSATSGKINADQCHPFAIDKEPLVKGYTKQNILFHNGIIHGLGNTRLSDTAQFASEVLHKIRPSLWAITCEITSDKFALWRVGGEPELIGYWQDYGKCKVSNFFWRAFSEPVKSRKGEVKRRKDDPGFWEWQEDYFYNGSWDTLSK